MNNLKFRVWYEGDNEYKEVHSINFYKQTVDLIEGYYNNAPVISSLLFEEVIIEQYTGLKDKNGVEIFEGDILYFDPYKTHSNDRVIEHIDGAYRGRLIRNGYSKLLAECVYETKIIGNIHENKELLNG